ncbi:MAG TPA: cation-transporting P-type ATPase, partial [Chitinophagaceae bacterium]|nr:cation-transporting P-type ATPase [Chitinophagaceae bacterium]
MDSFWTYHEQELFQQLNSSVNGISDEQALEKVQQQKSRLKIQPPFVKDLLLLVSQYKNPLVLLLVFAVILSATLGDYSESAIIFIVLLLTGVLGFFQERNA